MGGIIKNPSPKPLLYVPCILFIVNKRVANKGWKESKKLTNFKNCKNMIFIFLLYEISEYLCNSLPHISETMRYN